MQVLQKGKQCMCCKFPVVLKKIMVMAEAIGSSTRRFVTVMEAGHIWAHAAGGPPVLENLSLYVQRAMDVWGELLMGSSGF